MQKKNPSFVIGLGASAGGLDALEKFFDHAPANSGGAYVVVMHLSRDFKSMLDELLARHTVMPVKPANRNTPLEANTIYVIQPGTTVQINGMKLQVASRPEIDPTGPATSIDTLFQSIATHWRENGGAVVLSGSGSDGSAGIKAVYDAQGFTGAQSPETATFDSMPVAAISTGAVRAIEAPEQLGQTVVDGILLPALSINTPIVSESDQALKSILDSVVGSSTLDASKYKHSTFERRVRRRMMDLQLGSLKDYANKIAKDPEEAQKLSDMLLIGVTKFFRDEEAFAIIRRQIIPEIIRNAQENDRAIRVWIPGCATGQEAYTQAILFAEALHDMPYRIEVQIFATDVNKDFLAVAGRGEYTSDQIESVPSLLREKYFTKLNGDNRWLVNSEIRKMVVFAPHDVLSDPPFARLDMVSCRNMLIYFSIEAQQKILNNFAFGLLEKSFLFLGPSETVGAQREAFDFIDARNRIFRRTQSKRANLAMGSLSDSINREISVAGKSKQKSRMRESALQPAYAAMLKDFAPASLLISRERELLHSFGNARNFVRPPDGVTHYDIADMVDPALKTPLIAGIERAIRDKKPITFSRVILDEFPTQGQSVDLTIRPLEKDREATVDHVIAIIDEQKYTEPEAVETISTFSSDEMVEERIQELESELERTREALQSTIEEIETTNEELQASNEELMSANEELQSTNEELSSVNEELYSVNAEYHRQNDDLTRLSGDFDMLLHATDIGVIFLDKAGHITRYTSLAGSLFNLADSDLNRPISNFRSPFPELDPADLMQTAIQESHVIEKETVDSEGAAWLVRATADEMEQGAIIIFINISRLRNAELEARESASRLEFIRDVSKSYFVEMSPDFESIVSELGYFDTCGIEDKTLPCPAKPELFHPDDRERTAEALLDFVKESGGSVVARVWNEKAQCHRFITHYAVLNDRGNWDVAGIDVDEIANKERLATEQQAVIEATMTASDAVLAYVGSDKKYKFSNQKYRDLFGIERDDINGISIVEILPKSAYEELAPQIDLVLSGQSVETIAELGPEGEVVPYSLHIHPVMDDHGEVLGYVVSGMAMSYYLELAEKTNRLDRLIARSNKNSSLPVLTVDQSTGTVEYANKYALRKLGIENQLDLKKGVKISRLTPEWSDKRWAAMLQDIEPGNDKLESGVFIFDSNSNTTEADLMVSIPQAEEDDTTAVITVFENPEKIRILDDLRIRSRQLAISNRDLEQFTSVVAHDLRAPLRHISQFSKMLEEQYGELEEAEAKNYVSIIGDSTKSLSGMVNGLLDYARLGRSDRAMEPCDLVATIEMASQLLASEIEEASADLIVDELPLVLGDQELLARLFQNLISNAIKYRHPKKTPKIKIFAQQSGKAVSILIEDNGIGIAADYADKIFQLFQRLHTDQEYAGLGLGLSTCRRIAEIHGGNIELDKQFSGGSRFILTLPISDEEEHLEGKNAKGLIS